MKIKKATLYFYFLLFIIVFFGIYIRFDDKKEWVRYADLFYYKDQPLYSEYDSFYFARIANDVKKGTFWPGRIDNLRGFPDNSSEAQLDKKNKFYIEYSLSGNFISVIWAYLSRWFSISLEKLTFYLIPFLAVTVIFPLFFYFRDLKIPYAGLFGGLIVVSAPMYWGRTNLMRLDHDVLNLTLPFLISYLFYKFFKSSIFKKKLFLISLASFTLIFYQLWYGHPNLNFILISMFILKLMLEKGFFKTEPFKKEDLIFLGILIIPQVWYLYQGPIHLYKQVMSLVFNIKSPTAAEILFKDFPNIFISISELQKVSAEEVFRNIVFNKFVGILGLIGTLLLFVIKWRDLLFLLPFLGIGLLSFVSGARFIMYLAPFIGIGLGFLVYLTFEKFLQTVSLFKDNWKKDFIVHLTGTATFVFLLVVQLSILNFTSIPKVYSFLVKDMEYLKNNLPKDAAIWTWWDYGYAFQYYSERPTFHDGGSQNTPKTYFIARSFSTYDPREAWYITSFLTNYGLKGIVEELKKGTTAKELVKAVQQGKFLAPLKNPVYWVFTEDLIPKFSWIYYFGSYDFDKKQGIHGNIIIPERCKNLTSYTIVCEDINAKLDLSSGTIDTFRNVIPIHKVVIKRKDKLEEKRFFDNGMIVEIIEYGKNQAMLVILQPFVFETMFNKMFLLRKYEPKYFELILDDFPYMVVYKVREEV